MNVIGEKGRIVVGTVHPLDYREQVRRVLTHAIPATLVTLRYESGLTVTVPLRTTHGIFNHSAAKRRHPICAL